MPSVGRVVSTNVSVLTPTAYFPRGATFGGWAFAVVLAVTPGAVATAPVVNSPTVTVAAARRARHRRGVRTSIIVLLVSVRRSPVGGSSCLLLKRRDAGLIRILAQPLERCLVVLQVAVKEVQRYARHRRWDGIVAASVRR